MFEKLNQSSNAVIREGTDLMAMPFVSLKDLVNGGLKAIEVEGYFFTKGNYGTQVCVISKGNKITLPSRYTETFENFEDEEKKAILEGHLKLDDLKIIKTKTGKETIVFSYVDC